MDFLSGESHPSLSEYFLQACKAMDLYDGESVISHNLILNAKARPGLLRRVLISGSFAEKCAIPSPKGGLQGDVDLMITIATVSEQQQQEVLSHVEGKPGFVMIDLTTQTDPETEKIKTNTNLIFERNGRVYLSLTNLKKKLGPVAIEAHQCPFHEDSHHHGDHSDSAGCPTIPVEGGHLWTSQYGRGYECTLEEFQAGLPSRVYFFDFMVCFFADCGQNIDTVPCIECPGWPSIADEWIQRTRQWPDVTEIQKIVRKGYHLVHKSSEDGDTDLEWRLSFSLAELHLARLRNDVQRKCYILLKAIYYQHLKPLIVNKILVSYHLKTLMFWVCEKVPHQVWTPDHIGECVLLILEELLRFLVEKNCPHFFLPQINLFGNVQSHQFAPLIRVVAELHKNPKTIFSTSILMKLKNVTDAFRSTVEMHYQMMWKKEILQNIQDSLLFSREGKHGPKDELSSLMVGMKTHMIYQILYLSGVEIPGLPSDLVERSLQGKLFLFPPFTNLRVGFILHCLTTEKMMFDNDTGAMNMIPQFIGSDSSAEKIG